MHALVFRDHPLFTPYEIAPEHPPARLETHLGVQFWLREATPVKHQPSTTLHGRGRSGSSEVKRGQEHPFASRTHPGGQRLEKIGPELTRPHPRRPQDRIREHDEIVHRAPSPPERTDIAPGIGQRGQRQATVLDDSAVLRPSMRLTACPFHCAVSRIADDMQQRVVLKTPRQWQAPEGRCSGVRKRHVVGQSERECRGSLMEGGWRVRGIHRPGGSTQI